MAGDQYEQQKEGGSQATMDKPQQASDRSQSSYDSSFLEQILGNGTSSKQDAVFQVLAHFDNVEQQARTARQTVWGLSLILREQTQQIISSLPPIVAKSVVEEITRKYPELSSKR